MPEHKGNTEEFTVTIIADMGGHRVSQTVTGMAALLKSSRSIHQFAETMVTVQHICLQKLSEAVHQRAEPPVPARTDYAVLSQAPVIGSLPKDTLHRLLAVVRPRKVGARETLVAANDPADGMYVLVSGQMQAVIGGEPGMPPFVLSVIQPGELIGDISAFDGGPRTATVEAITECNLLHIPQSAVRSTILSDVTACFEALSLICQRLRSATSRQQVALLPLQDRVIRVILLLLEKVPDGGRAPAVLNGLTQDLIAQMTGATRPRVSEALKELEAAGLIRRGHRQILIPEPDLLRDKT